MELNPDIDWEVKIYRALSTMYTEDMSLIFHSDFETIYDDETLRAKSFMVTQPLDGGRNYTSHLTLDVKR